MSNKNKDNTSQFIQSDEASQSPENQNAGNKMSDFRKAQLMKHREKKIRNGKDQSKQNSINSNPPTFVVPQAKIHSPETEEEKRQKEIEAEVKEFKNQIELKFLQSVQQHTFQFPLEQDFTQDSDSELQSLKEITTYCLHDQNIKTQKKQPNLLFKEILSNRDGDINSKLQRILDRVNTSKLDSQKQKLKTEGDVQELTKQNNSKNVKVNYFQKNTLYIQNPYEKSQALYETIKQRTNEKKSEKSFSNDRFKPQVFSQSNVQSKKNLLNHITNPSSKKLFSPMGINLKNVSKYSSGRTPMTSDSRQRKNQNYQSFQTVSRGQETNRSVNKFNISTIGLSNRCDESVEKLKDKYTQSSERVMSAFPNNNSSKNLFNYFSTTTNMNKQQKLVRNNTSGVGFISNNNKRDPKVASKKALMTNELSNYLTPNLSSIIAQKQSTKRQENSDINNSDSSFRKLHTNQHSDTLKEILKRAKFRIL